MPAPSLPVHELGQKSTMLSHASKLNAPSTCPACGGSLPAGAEKCPFCDTWLHSSGSRNGKRRGKPVETVRLPEVGLRRPAVLTMLALVLPLSLLGWLLEWPGSYWSSDGAIAIWCGLVSLWTLLVGLAWRARDTRLLGLGAVFLLTALPFVAVVALRKGRLNDDALGLATLVGGCAAVAFSLGFLLNSKIRRILAGRIARRGR